MDVIKKNKNSLLLIALIIYCVDPLAIWMLKQGMVFPDFRSFYVAGLSVLNSVNPYDIVAVKEYALSIKLSGYIYPYLYPPILASALQPVSVLPPIASAIIWLSINSLFLCSTFILIYRWFCQRDESSEYQLPISILLVFLVALPFHANLQMGQVNIIVLYCLLLSFYFSEQQAFFKSGFFLAVASLIKVTPAGFLVFFLFSGQSKVVKSFLLCSLALIMFFYPLGADFELWHAFFHSVASTMSNDVTGLSLKTQVFNYSLIQSLSRLFESQLLVYIVYFFQLIVMSFMALFLTFKLQGQYKRFSLLLYCLLMVLLAPITYTHHLIYLLPGLLFFYVYLLCFETRKLVIVFSILLFLSCIDFPVWYESKGVTQAWLHSINCYLLLLMYFFASFLLWRFSRRESFSDTKGSLCSS